MSVTVSGEIDRAIELRLRISSKRAERPLASTVTGAVEIYTDVPQEVSSLVRELRSEGEDEMLRQASDMISKVRTGRAEL